MNCRCWNKRESPGATNLFYNLLPLLFDILHFSPLYNLLPYLFYTRSLTKRNTFVAHLLLILAVKIAVTHSYGPSTSRYNRPSHPKFSSDMRTCRWTDSRGDHEPYVSAVRRWCEYYYFFHVNNWNSKLPELHGLTLHAQLYDRAATLRQPIPGEIIGFIKGFDAIIDAFYKHDSQFILSSLYCDFSSFFATKRGSTETFQNFESRFCASVP